MSGAQIGGIVGGAIGFVASGFNPMGAQIGYAIGASVGAYVDPVRTYGPRINDASAQTSSVGRVIPFGYGTFTTAGNVIWRDPKLREHAKHQRQGKGSGGKSTTYTYTRSYAIGICRGPVYGVKWIKRNGKKVYTTDQAATQEEKEASAKFAAKLKIYLGTETQMPDPTIVAVEGMGNVPGHRGLAYIVVEHDDLTDLGGSVPQYEFCVIASPPDIFCTSKPYPLLLVDAIKSTAVPRNGTAFKVTVDEFESSASAINSLGVRAALQQTGSFVDQLESSGGATGGSLRKVLSEYKNGAPDEFVSSGKALNGQVKKTLVKYTNGKPDSFESSAKALNGSLIR